LTGPARRPGLLALPEYVWALNGAPAEILPLVYKPASSVDIVENVKLHTHTIQAHVSFMTPPDQYYI
jgi:hypothetical protein